MNEYVKKTFFLQPDGSGMKKPHKKFYRMRWPYKQWHGVLLPQQITWEDLPKKCEGNKMSLIPNQNCFP